MAPDASEMMRVVMTSVGVVTYAPIAPPSAPSAASAWSVFTSKTMSGDWRMKVLRPSKMAIWIAPMGTSR